MANKTYLAKIYKSGVYQGTLPYVITDVEYDEQINTAGTQATIKIASDLRTAGIGVSSDYLVTKTGNHITDNNGNRIITRKEYTFGKVPIDIGNQIDIWLYYSGAPNGIRRFTGLISSWEANELDATITLTALSFGVQLDNYLINITPGNYLLNYPAYNTSDTLYVFGSNQGPFNHTVAVAQTFQLISSTSISSITITVARLATYPYDITSSLYVFAGTPGVSGVPVGSATRVITNTSLQSVTYTFASPLMLTASTSYYWQLTFSADDTASMTVARDSTGIYTSGSGYTYNDTTTAWSAATGSYAFSVITSSGALGNQFNSYDPGDIVVSLLDNFTNAGGVVDSSTTSVGSTGTMVSYTFKYNTVLDGIKKCLELAPPNWYWYVDVGSNVLYFQQFSLNANHTFSRGDEVNELQVKYTLENMKNNSVLSGGDDPLNPGTNIVSTTTNQSSIVKYGQWLDMNSDSRVTLKSTADTMTQTVVGAYSKPQFTATGKVLATKYDIETLAIGNMTAFRNYNALTNDLILQIVAIHRTPDMAIVTWANLPPTQVHRIEDIKRNLDNLQTANNPSQ